ncbi:MAG: 6-phosphofructokinase [Bdellovibrionota bacterium]
MAIKKIGLLTSGGDAPGMNAAIRAVVRRAAAQQIQVYGILGGYAGLIQHHARLLLPREMGQIIQRGGTILKTGRSLDFMKAEVRTTVAEYIKTMDIDALAVIGGDGSFRGAHALYNEHKIPVVGIPGTIDNDIPGTDLTIGFDTAVNTALDAIDKIRDTADSHDRLFIVEVMGRNSSFIAAYVGLAGGAEEIFTPDGHTTMDRLADQIKESQKKGKLSSIIITAEGQKPGRAYDLADGLRKRSGLEAKVCILGHTQRGGAPTAIDRVLASRMGVGAVDALVRGETCAMVGIQKNEIVLVPFSEITNIEKKSPMDLIQLSNQLAL